MNVINLSIIIPHFNRPMLLKRLLSSIPTDPGVQVIVIDDRSDQYLDEYAKIVKSPNYSHVTFLSNTSEQKGAGACRNIALDIAVGTWVLFADSDDYFGKNLMQKVTPYFSSSFDVVFFQPKNVSDTGHLLDEKKQFYSNLMNAALEKPTNTNILAVKYRFPVCWSKLIRLTLIKNNNIQFGLTSVSEDEIFSTKVAFYMKQFKIVQDTIYYHTIAAGTLTTTVTRETFSENLAARAEKWSFLNNRLDASDLSKCNISSAGLLITSLITHRFELKYTWNAYKLLHQAGVPLLTKNQLKPDLLLKKVIHKIQEVRLANW
jgi:glycosyltransferase involved in cell wall biosynthesis